MKYMRACIIAFSMYSKIPMPQIEWREEDMEYAMCFFPFVGAAAGAFFYFWGMYGRKLPVGNLCYGVVFTLIPVVVTGGIHLDGFLDTLDALASWQNRERRLEILADPHTGAFAVIGCCVYFLTYFGLATELEAGGISAVALGFFFSRCLSGYAVTAFPCAKDSGLAAAFANAANKKRAGRILLLETAVVMAILLCTGIFVGGAVIAASLAAFLWYRIMSQKKFGGITGDLAGWFLQVCELMILAAAVIAGKLFEAASF